MSSRNNSSIYRLLEIKSTSGKLLILLPPIYALWLMAIGKTVLRKQNKSDKTFSFFSIMTFACFSLILLSSPFASIVNDPVNDTKMYVRAVLLLTFFCWFVTIGILANQTIKFDRRKSEERFYTFVDNLDYVKRFFVFVYWQFTIWSFQKTVNEYNR